MSLLIPGTNSIKDTGYDVANSARFNVGSSDNIQRTYGTPTNAKIFGLSWWVKLGKAWDGSGSQDFWGERADGSNRVFHGINADGTFQYFEKNGGSTTLDIKTNRLFRDNSAWYHFLLLGDSTQGTAANRLKLYINGVQETSFSTESYPSSDYQFRLAVGSSTKYFGRIGLGGSLSTNYYDGYLAEAVFVDGTVTAHTDYGEFDEDSPTIWKPKDVSGLTFGDNGFYLDFEDSSALGNDVSGNDNDFTVNNLTAVDQSTDTCTNNFATMNPLAKSSTGTSTFANGNLKISTNESQLFGAMTTIGVTQGKWYAECKKISQDSGGGDTLSRLSFGVTNKINHSTNNPTGDAGNYYVYGIDHVYNGATNLGSLAGTSHIADGKIQMIALDLDNNRVTFGANGQWMDGSGSYNQSSPSSYVSITDPADTDAGYFFFQGDGSSTRGYTGEWNFGGTQTFTISSGNADANGYGNFEYAPPSGYYSLCTKNLSEFG